MEERASYATGGPENRAASAESVRSLLLLRGRLGFAVLGAEKISQSQVNHELACLTRVLHAIPRTAAGSRQQ